MGANSKIAWTDATWNPFRGCWPVSPGCQNCYAERMCARGLPGLKSPTTGEDFARRGLVGLPHWTGKVELIESALMIPLRWRKPRRIFVNSMSDTFHEGAPDEWIDRIFATMALCPQHTFILCTKRAKRLPKYIADATLARVQNLIDDMETWDDSPIPADECAPLLKEWPLPNVALLASVEDQPRADQRIPELLATPAAVRGISLEPMLGPVNLTPWLKCCWACSGGLADDCGYRNHGDQVRLDWVIVGGESGPGARPCHIEWIRDVVRQCREAGVACFVKQLGANPQWSETEGYIRTIAGNAKLRSLSGDDPAEWPEDLCIQQFPEMRNV